MSSRRDSREYDRYDRHDRSSSRKRPYDDRSEQLPEIDSVFRGEVVSIQVYGAFIKIPGNRKNGLVHKSEISTTRVDEVDDVLSVGDQVFCKVLSHGDDGNNKISLSMKDVNQQNGKPWERENLNDINERDDREDVGRRRRNDDEPMPELYSIFKGEVTSIQDYGAFIKIPRFRKNGLVHKSQLSNTRVEEVSDVLSVGDVVFCKVISLGEDGSNKISLSMKVVNQGNGNDLDPNLVITNQEEMKRSKGGGYTQKSIELGAVFNTVCRTCGVKGHLSQNCFSAQQGGKTYELLPELDLSVPAQPEKSLQEPEGGGHIKKKKKKKEKKVKKSKKKKHKRKSSSSESDSSSSDSESDSHRRHHPKKHTDLKKSSKKKKKHKRQSSSSESDSSSSDSESDSHRRHHQKKHKDVGRHKQNYVESSRDSDRRKSHHKRSNSSDSDGERSKRHKQKKHHRDR